MKKDNFFGFAYYNNRILGWLFHTNIQHHSFLSSIPNNIYNPKKVMNTAKYQPPRTMQRNYGPKGSH